MADDIERLIKDLGKIPKDLRKELRPGIKWAAKPVLDQVKRNASWSTRIPKATRLSIKFSGREPGAAIVVNAKKAPHGWAYENKGKEGTFRHPVYGNRSNWVTQKARPFAAPAVRAKGDEAERRIARIVDVVTRAAGFR